LGEAPFCHNCGLDFRAAGAPQMPPEQTLPASQSVYGAPPPPPTGFYQAPGYPPQPGYFYPPAWQYGQPSAPPPSGQAPAPWGATPQYQPQYQPPQVPAPQMPPPTPVAATSDSTAVTADEGSSGFAVVPATAPLAAPTVCLRCYSQLPAGYTSCANCGFDNGSVFAASTLAPARIPMLAVALALLGAGLLITAAALVFVAQAAG
jgi:uncharacterized protein (DUF983 family)